MIKSLDRLSIALSLSLSLFFFLERKRSIFVGWKKSRKREGGGRIEGWNRVTKEVSISITMDDRIPSARLFFSDFDKDKIRQRYDLQRLSPRVIIKF